MLTVNEVVEDPAATVVFAGTVNPLKPVLVREMLAPVDGAAFDRVAVQVLLAFAPSVAGLHCSDEIAAGATRLMLVLWELPL